MESPRPLSPLHSRLMALCHKDNRVFAYLVKSNRRPTTDTREAPATKLPADNFLEKDKKKEIS